MPWIVWPCVGYCGRSVADGLFVLCRSVVVLCETRRPLSADWPGGTAERCATQSVIVFYNCLTIWLLFSNASFSCHLHCIIGPTGSTMNQYIYSCSYQQ